MKKVLFGILSIIMLILVACAVNAGVNHEQNAAPASAEENIVENSIAPGNKVDLVLFTGQSNMLGRDKELYETEIPEGKAFGTPMSMKPYIPCRIRSAKPLLVFPNLQVRR